MPQISQNLKDQRRKLFGRWLLGFSFLLFFLQFFLKIKGDFLPTGNTLISYSINLGPLILLLTSLYLLFGKKEIPQKPLLFRILVMLLASYSIGGGMLLILLMVGAGTMGNQIIDLIFDNFGLAILLSTCLAFPFANKYLR